MSTLNITEYAEQAKDIANRVIPVGVMPALAVQVLTFTTTSVPSATFNAKTKFIRVISDVDAFIDVAVSPTAAATTTKIAQDSSEYFGITQSGLKIAVRDNA